MRMAGGLFDAVALAGADRPSAGGEVRRRSPPPRARGPRRSAPSGRSAGTPCAARARRASAPAPLGVGVGGAPQARLARRGRVQSAATRPCRMWLTQPAPTACRPAHARDRARVAGEDGDPQVRAQGLGDRPHDGPAGALGVADACARRAPGHRPRVVVLDDERVRMSRRAPARSCRARARVAARRRWGSGRAGSGRTACAPDRRARSSSPRERARVVQGHRPGHEAEGADEVQHRRVARVLDRHARRRGAGAPAARARCRPCAPPITARWRGGDAVRREVARRASADAAPAARPAPRRGVAGPRPAARGARAAGGSRRGVGVALGQVAQAGGAAATGARRRRGGRAVTRVPAAPRAGGQPAQAQAAVRRRPPWPRSARAARPARAPVGRAAPGGRAPVRTASSTLGRDLACGARPGWHIVLVRS